jgi:hypothetical protein
MENEDNIITKIIDAMELIEGMVDKNGQDKKVLVIKYLSDNMDNQIFNKYEDFISITIDFIILVSKKRVKLNLNNINKKCFLCYS